MILKVFAENLKGWAWSTQTPEWRDGLMGGGNVLCHLHKKRTNPMPQKKAMLMLVVSRTPIALRHAHGSGGASHFGFHVLTIFGIIHRALPITPDRLFPTAQSLSHPLKLGGGNACGTYSQLWLTGPHHTGVTGRKRPDAPGSFKGRRALSEGLFQTYLPNSLWTPLEFTDAISREPLLLTMSWWGNLVPTATAPTEKDLFQKMHKGVESILSP